MQYEVNKNKLIVDGKVVYEAPAEIDDTLVSKFNPEAIMIIYDGFRLRPEGYHSVTNPIFIEPSLQEAINQNVLCIDKKGNVIWRIESTFDYPEDHVRFTKNPPNYDDVWVYRRDAKEFKIDPANGKILDRRLGL